MVDVIGCPTTLPRDERWSLLQVVNVDYYLSGQNDSCFEIFVEVLY